MKVHKNQRALNATKILSSMLDCTSLLQRYLFRNRSHGWQQQSLQRVSFWNCWREEDPHSREIWHRRKAVWFSSSGGLVEINYKNFDLNNRKKIVTSPNIIINNTIFCCTPTHFFFRQWQPDSWGSKAVSLEGPSEIVIVFWLNPPFSTKLSPPNVH